MPTTTPWAALLTSLAADPAAADGLAALAQYGVLGVIAALLLVFARGSIQRERDRADRLEAETQRLNNLLLERDNLVLERVIPAIMSATNAAEESAALLAAMQRAREIADAADRHRSGGAP